MQSLKKIHAWAQMQDPLYAQKLCFRGHLSFRVNLHLLLQSTLVNSTMHNSILSLISTRWLEPRIFSYILLQFHNVYLDNG